MLKVVVIKAKSSASAENIISDEPTLKVLLTSIAKILVIFEN